MFSLLSCWWWSNITSFLDAGLGGRPISLRDGMMKELMLENPLSFSMAENLLPAEDELFPPCLSHFSLVGIVKLLFDVISEKPTFDSSWDSFRDVLLTAVELLLIVIIELMVLRINRSIRYASFDNFAVSTSSGAAAIVGGDGSQHMSSSISLIVELFPSNLCFGESRLKS